MKEFIEKEWEVEHCGKMIMVCNAEGEPIGEKSLDKKFIALLKKREIYPQKVKESHCVCSIGFSEKEQKWYGWSHRAFCGFGIGHIAKEGDCHTTSGWTEEYLKEHPEEDLSVPVGFECKTLEDCKRCAIAFAESVS